MGSSEKKCCRNCQYSGVRDHSLCCLITDDEYPPRVSGNGCCERYSEKRTLESSGYSSGSSCFLTTACVEFLGKPDDCYELTTLRRFRDGYLKKRDGGEALVAQYYAIAPKIVDKINQLPSREEYYKRIYDKIVACITCIEADDNDGALAIYKEMVVVLQKELLEE